MFSKIAWGFSSLLIVCTAFFFCPRWERFGGESSLGWDVSGYYFYLPATFIYQDLKQLKFADSILPKYQFTGNEMQQANRQENGNYVMTYSAGMAVMFAPAFATAHAIAPLTKYPADGFSKPYQFALALQSLLVAVLGLWFFRKLMRFYFSDATVGWLILALCIGSNYLNWAAIDSTLSHNYLFTLYVFLLLCTSAFYQRPRLKFAFGIGCLSGLIILARPSEMVCLLIPFLWGLESLKLSVLKERLQFFRRQWKPFLTAAIPLILIGSVQLIYWKYASGHWFVYSYGSDKGFSWLHPHFYDYMFSSRSGWLVYSPMLLMAFGGIIPFIKTGKNKVAILSFFLLNLYIVSAWDIWWYGGRAMIQSYPVILFPLACLIEYLRTTKLVKWIALPFFLLFAYVNIWFTINAHAAPGLYDPDGMSRQYIRAVIGRWNVPEETMKLKDTKYIFTGEIKDARLVYENDFSQDSSAEIVQHPSTNSPCIMLDKTHENSSIYSFPFIQKNATWIRAEASFFIPQKEWTTWRMTQFIVEAYDGQNKVSEATLRAHRFLNDGETRRLYVDLRLKDVRADSITIHFWNVGSDKSIYIDNLKVWGFSGEER